MSEKLVIGRYDKIDLPELELFNLDSKIDSGAYTSAIHYHHAEVVIKDNKEQLHFTLLDPEHPDYNDKSFYFQSFDRREIRNSFGESEERYVIETDVLIFGERFKAEFSLSDRGNLKFPLLLGRKLLRKRFIVDVAKKNLSHKQKLKNNQL